MLAFGQVCNFVDGITVLMYGRLMDCPPHMFRAQSLYKMRNWASPERGMHWYSELHLKTGTAYARDHPENQREWIGFIQSYGEFPQADETCDGCSLASLFGLNEWSRSTTDGSPTMNKKLFRLLL